MTPQKIAEKVIHVDFGGFFVIFLTESGDLYGVGANLNGVMGIDVSEKEDYFMNPSQNVVTKPVCLMKDVKYARAGLRGITALKNDGSVWWWGEVRTTSAINIEDTIGVCNTKPEKMLDGGIFVTCGDFCVAAITEDGTLWTWGNNTFGSCGYDSGNEDFIEKPVAVLKDVNMVWMDEARFDSLEERLNFGSLSPYKCNYSYVIFVEKKDGTLLACGLEVMGEESKSRSYKLYGDIVRTPDQMNGEIQYDPVTILYSDVFQPIEFKQKDRQPQIKFRDLNYGMSVNKVMDFLNALEIKYKIVDGFSDGEKVYNLVTEDQYFIFWFNNAKELTAISYNAYGTRNGKIKIGMTKEEVEKFLNAPSLEKISTDNNSYVTSYYKNDFNYEIGYYEGVSYYIKESMIDIIN